MLLVILSLLPFELASHLALAWTHISRSTSRSKKQTLFRADVTERRRPRKEKKPTRNDLKGRRRKKERWSKREGEYLQSDRSLIERNIAKRLSFLIIAVCLQLASLSLLHPLPSHLSLSSLDELFSLSLPPKADVRSWFFSLSLQVNNPFFVRTRKKERRQLILILWFR